MKPMTEEHLAVLRRHMVELIAIQVELLEEELGKAALDGRVLEAMRRVPRHLFVPAPFAALAYDDRPLPIGFGKTISQPFMCALMADLLAPGPHDAVLEVGTGLGYQTALLAELADRVWSVEIVEELAAGAEMRLDRLGYSKVGIRIGDGSARLGRTRALRQDPGGGGGRAGAAGAARAAQAGRAAGPAAGPCRGATAHRDRQGRGRPHPRPAADPGAVQPARDGHLRAAAPARRTQGATSGGDLPDHPRDADRPPPRSARPQSYFGSAAWLLPPRHRDSGRKTPRSRRGEASRPYGAA